MKKLFAWAGLVTASVACQPQAAQTPAAPEVAASTNQPASPAKTAPPAIADSLTPQMRTMLRQVDLANLFRDNSPVLDGFFGNNPQRLSLALVKVTRDSLKPGLFHIVGKSRYKKQVAAFTGSIQLTSVADYYDQGRLLSQGEDTFIQDTTAGGTGDILNARAYSAAGVFSFTSKAPVTYALSGRALLDFWITDKGKIGGLYSPCEGCVEEEAPTKGSGLLMRGSWLDTNTKSRRPFLVCRDVFFISNNLIADFAIGDRGAQVNPKYDKQGWRDYWENDEWWADAPKPSLSL